MVLPGPLMSASVLALTLMAPVHAKQPNQLVCHIDEFGEIVPKMLPANAASAHTGHGDPDPQTFYLDADEDLYQSDAPNTSFYGCSAPDERYTPLILEGLDCDDDNSDINPGATEVAGNNVDENCDGVVEVEQATVLARAYIDVNRNGDYDGAIDVNISQLLDSDENGIPSVGDEVLLGQYPTTFDPCPAEICQSLGAYVTGPFVVDSVTPTPSTTIFVGSNAEAYLWNATQSSQERFERQSTAPTSANLDLFRDQHTASPTTDVTKITQTGLASPDTPAFISSIITGDDYFINVEFPGTP